MVLSVCVLEIRNHKSVDTSVNSPAANVTTFCNISHSVAVSTDLSELHLINSGTGTLTRQVKTSSIISHISASNKFLIAASMDGSISMYDPQTAMRKADVESAVKAHTNGIQGLQTSGNYIFTIGFGLRYTPLPPFLAALSSS